MSSQTLKHHPLTLSLQLVLLATPALASAQQLIASGEPETAAGTYDTGTKAGRDGTALIAEQTFGQIDGNGVTVITRGANADGAYAWDAGVIRLVDSAITTSGAEAYGLRAEGKGSISFEGGRVTTSGENGHGVVAVTSGEGNGVVQVKNSTVSVGNAAVIAAEGSKSRVVATNMTGNTTGGTVAGGAPAMISAQSGGLVQLVGGSFESTTNSPALRAAGAGSTITTTRGTKVTITNDDSGAVAAVGGGIVSLGQDTALTSAGRGLFARDDGSRITTVGATVKAAREFGALASEKGVIELTQGEVTGHDAGLRALGGGKIQATGTQVVATKAGDGAIAVYGAAASKDGTILLGANTSVTGDNGIGALGGTIKVEQSSIKATGTLGAGTRVQGIGVSVSPGGQVELVDSVVDANEMGIRYGFDPVQAGMTAKVVVEGGSVTARKGTAVFMSGAEEDGAAGELQLRRGAVLQGADEALIEVYRGTGPKAELRVFADGVALSGNLFADSGAVLDLTMTNASSLAGAITGGNALDISADSRWDVKGSSGLNTLRNAGTIAFAAPAQGGYKTVTVNGDYTGDNGALTLNTSLGGDSSPSDRLWVKGNTAGSTALTVNNTGGSGAQTIEGIPLVKVDGSSAGLFALNGRVVAGAYEYRLFKGGVSTPDDGDWYLRSQAEPPPKPKPVDPVDPTNPTNPANPTGPTDPVQPTPVPTPGPKPTPTHPGKPAPAPLYRPEAGAYLANQAASMGLFQHQMHDRMGEPDFARGPERAPAVWTRVVRRQIDGHAGFDQLDVGSDTSLLQVGGELATWTAGNSRFHFGGMAAAGRADSNVASTLSGYRAKGKVRGYAGGLYATWFGSADTQAGPYADAWLQYGRFDNKVGGDYLAQESYDASSWSASLEGGYTFAMPSGEGFAWFIEPQLQAIYSDYDADRHIEASGTWIGSSLAGQLTTRVGLRVFGNAGSGTYNLVQPFVMLNWWRNDQRNNLSMDSAEVTLGWPRDRYEAKLGAQLQLGGGWTGWGEAAWQTGSDGFRDIGGQIGVNYRW